MPKTSAVQNCSKLDKRTKAYKECKKAKEENKMKGAGDLVEKVTKATGIKAGVDYLSKKFGVDCGCETRKEWLNELLPFHKNNKRKRCPDKKEAEFIRQIKFTERQIHGKGKPINGKFVTADVSSKSISEVYSRVMGTQYNHPTCNCAATVIKQTQRASELVTMLEVCEKVED